MGFKIEKSLNGLLEQLKKAQKDVADEAEEAVNLSIKEIFEATQIKVPKETTALMDSGRVEWKSRAGKVRSASIIYGNSETDRIGVFYAAAVHEILDAQHAAPTGPKYVEIPLEDGKQAFKRRLAKAAEKSLGKKTL